MCRGLTELHWIGYSTESIWIRRFKLSTSIPGINTQTCWSKAVSHVTNGTICCICSTSWVTPHFPAAISFFFKQKASRDVEKVTRKLFAWFAYSESEIKTDESRVSSVLVNETELTNDQWSHQDWRCVSQLWETIANLHVKRFDIVLSERSQGNTVKNDPEHPEQGYGSTCSRETRSK